MIIFKQSVIQYLDELVLVLYINEYFGYIENAELFVDKLTDYINENIITFPARKTPLKIKYLGSKYMFYKSNQRTTWYIFFEQKDTNFVITNIINSNSKEVKWL
jgi:hypothetical protein